MPIYTYRREDGSLIEIRQGFEDDPLQEDPETGMSIWRVVSKDSRPAILFKGGGFYVNDARKVTNAASSV